MNITELSKKLNEMFYSGENRVSMAFLFMIMYHNDIERILKEDGYSVSALCKILQEKACLPGNHYDAELNKGYKLAKFVEVKDEYKGRW